MATLDDVRRIAANLPGAIEGTDVFGFGVEEKGKVKGFVWLWNERIHPKKPKVRNPGVLAVTTPGLAAKDVLLSSNPAVYFTEPHYNGFPAVLVRVEAIGVEELEDLLVEAWRCKAPKKVVEAFDAGQG